jgi:excisionase family DNA binding protein
MRPELDVASVDALLLDDVREQQCPGAAKLLYTPAEAAHCLAIGRTKLFELMRDGSLPSVRIGAVRRIRLRDLEAFVAGSLVSPDEPTVA